MGGVPWLFFLDATHISDVDLSNKKKQKATKANAKKHTIQKRKTKEPQAHSAHLC